MTVELRPRRSLYHAEGGWFEANWHFSFDRFWDDAHMGLGDLRVFNDDRLIAGAAWPMHPHRDVEGITYVAEGTFEHADSLGNGGRLRPGGVQRMTLGSGAEHSERNGSRSEPMRFIQLWILPATRGLAPSVEQRDFAAEARRDRLLPVLVPADGYGGPDAPTSAEAVKVHQDAAMYAGLLSPAATVTHAFRRGFAGYLFVVHGSLEAPALDEGGAAALRDEREVAIRAGSGGAEVLLVETRAR